jgi:hypothetical protein
VSGNCEFHEKLLSEGRTFTIPDGVRRVGRQKLRWEDGVDQDMRILEVKNWKKVAQGRMGKAS